MPVVQGVEDEVRQEPALLDLHCSGQAGGVQERVQGQVSTEAEKEVSYIDAFGLLP